MEMNIDESFVPVTSSGLDTSPNEVFEVLVLRSDEVVEKGNLSRHRLNCNYLERCFASIPLFLFFLFLFVNLEIERSHNESHSSTTVKILSEVVNQTTSNVGMMATNVEDGTSRRHNFFGMLFACNSTILSFFFILSLFRRRA
jgi:hypothetical protein